MHTRITLGVELNVRRSTRSGTVPAGLSQRETEDFFANRDRIDRIGCILCFRTYQRTQHLRHRNTCVIVFMYGI